MLTAWMLTHLNQPDCELLVEHKVKSIQLVAIRPAKPVNRTPRPRVCLSTTTSWKQRKVSITTRFIDGSTCSRSMQAPTRLRHTLSCQAELGSNCSASWLAGWPGFTILQLKTEQFDWEQAASFYAPSSQQPYFLSIANFISSGPMVLMEVVA